MAGNLTVGDDCMPEHQAEHGNEPHLSLPAEDITETPQCPLLRNEHQKDATSTQEPDTPLDIQIHTVAEESIPPASDAKAARRRSTSMWHDSWVPELVSFSLAMLSLLAIVILLVIHKNKPLPKWPKMITINSLLAVFSTLLKMGLALPLSQGIGQKKWQWFRQSRTLADVENLDAASRGPLGSVLLFFRGAGHLMTYVGAFLTILTLLLDPFVQQLVHYNVCLEPKPHSIATIARTNFYAHYNYIKGPVWNEPIEAIFAAIIRGAVNPSDDPASYILTQCNTGNCTFSSPTNTLSNGATYSSVGLCSSCADISDQIQRNMSGDLPSYILPSGDDVYLQDRILYSNASAVTVTAWISGLGGSTMGTFRSLHYLADDSASAFSCSLYPCLKTYSGNIINGILSENIVETTPIGASRANSSGWSPWKSRENYILATNQTLRNGTYSRCVASTTNQTGYYPVASKDMESIPTNITFDSLMSFNGTPSTITDDALWYPLDCVWAFSALSAMSLDDYFTSLFQQQSVYANGITGRLGPVILSSFYAANHSDLSFVTQYWQNLTDAMTSVIRANGIERISDYAYGTTMFSDTCANVQWVWISLPALVVLGVMIFLGDLMVTNPGKRCEQPLWKSSALALAFTDLDIGETARGGALPTKSELDDIANETKVQISNSDGRPLLS
ncbi:Nn.00g059350.m01.CDS01 [Neocucurbitaria sp. VM-36]